MPNNQPLTRLLNLCIGNDRNESNAGTNDVAWNTAAINPQHYTRTQLLLERKLPLCTRYTYKHTNHCKVTLASRSAFEQISATQKTRTAMIVALLLGGFGFFVAGWFSPGHDHPVVFLYGIRREGIPRYVRR